MILTKQFLVLLLAKMVYWAFRHFDLGVPVLVEFDHSLSGLLFGKVAKQFFV